MQSLLSKARARHLNHLQKNLTLSLNSNALLPQALELLNRRAKAENSLMRYYKSSESSNLYIVEDLSLGKSRLVSSLQRCQWLYRTGFIDRYRQLGLSYCLDQVHLSSGDLVIDCGANYGDLEGYLGTRLDDYHYIGLEPSRIDYLCLKSNVSPVHATALNVALGDADATIELYEDVQSANSSVIPPPCYSAKYEVTMNTLGAVLEASGLRGRRVKLLKIEAEGYEPEICYGSSDCFDMIDYIAVDAGFERGFEQEATAPSVINYLTRKNFEVCGVGPLQYGLRLLFRNSNMAAGGL